MVRTLHRLAAVDTRILRAAAIAALWLLLVDLGLRTIGMRRVRLVLQRLVPRQGRRGPLTLIKAPAGCGVPPDSDRRTTMIQHAVDFAARHHLYVMTCLPRSLVLQTLLARAGIDSELRLGVRKAEGRLAAHAWVERGAHPVGEPFIVASRFAPLLMPETPR